MARKRLLEVLPAADLEFGGEGKMPDLDHLRASPAVERLECLTDETSGPHPWWGVKIWLKASRPADAVAA